MTEANKEQTDKAIEEAGRLAKEAKAKITSTSFGNSMKSELAFSLSKITCFSTFYLNKRSS